MATKRKAPKRKATKLEVFRLSRKRWLRGNSHNWSKRERAGNYGSTLYDPKLDVGCCLGLFALKCGLKKDQIADAGTPAAAIEYSVVPSLAGGILEEDHTKKVTSKMLEERLNGFSKLVRVHSKTRTIVVCDCKGCVGSKSTVFEHEVDDKEITNEMMLINDSRLTDDDYKIRMLTPLFKRIGIKLVLVS